MVSFGANSGANTTVGLANISIPVNIQTTGGVISSCSSNAPSASDLWTLNSGNNSIYYNGGNVGIGTATPGVTFDVVGGVVRGTIGTYPIQLDSDSTVLPVGSYRRIYTPNGGLYLLTGSGHIILSPASGNVGIGTNNPGYSLDVNTGSIQAAAFYYSSDRSLKANIEPLSEQGSMLDKIDELKGVSFIWKKTGEKSIGFIAQELQKIFPELVDTRNEGHWTVQYSALIPVVVEAVKELRQTFFNKASGLDDRMNKLEVRLVALEKENQRLKLELQGFKAERDQGK